MENRMKEVAIEIEELRAAAEQGDTDAMSELAIIYEVGDGVEEDISKAIYWHTLAAEHGDAREQIDLGHMYKIGQGVEKNYENALYWYRKAAEQNEPLAFDALGMMYLCGKGVEKDEEEAERLFCMAEHLRSGARR